MNNDLKIKKLGFFKSILFFLIPGAIFSFCIYFLIPIFVKIGFSVFTSFGLLFFTTTALMFPLVVVYYLFEGNKFNWDSIKERFWLYKMTKWDWLWTLGLIVFFYASFGLLWPTSKYLAQNIPFFMPPSYIPELYNPLIQISGNIPSSIGGFVLKGHWELIPLMFLLTNLNGFGLALWQRGIILPRQELYFGKWAWLVNGLLSALLFGLIFPWRIIQIIPAYLAVSFVTQKRKNQWPSNILLGIDGINFTLLIVFSVIGINK